MAQPVGTEAPSQVAVAVRVAGRAPYAMFDLVRLTSSAALLRGPLMLELGEQLTLLLEKGDRKVEVEGRITAVERGDGHEDPVTTVELGDATAIAPLLA
ncbi:MAG TPA: hypothetical protein VHE35_14555 [Kofleriaceae bacterium]|nr:hypothetical protein [Kofleriaceae bacterium]